jgi:CRP/FNR family transcriptional regulator
MDNIEIFKYLTAAQRDGILAQTNEVEYDAGTELFAANTLGNEMFLIKTGHVKIYKVFEGNEITFAELGPGDVFGEMSLLDDYPRSAAAATLTPATLYSLSRTAFRTFLDREPEIATKLLLAFAEVFSKRMRKTDKLLETYHLVNKALITNEEFRKLYTAIHA